LAAAADLAAGVAFGAAALAPVAAAAAVVVVLDAELLRTVGVGSTGGTALLGGTGTGGTLSAGLSAMVSP
jgi:hypothetical protein